MPKDWQDIAQCVGRPKDGHIGFHLNFTLPEATSEMPATERQEEAVRLFYQYRGESLQECQAHALLSCREYARLSSNIIFKAYPERIRHMLTRCLAAFITSDAQMVRFATKWSERNFERGTGSPRVRGTPYFADLEQFASYLTGDMEMNGWTLQDLRQAEHREF